MDEDPMAFLNAQREKMAQLSAMSGVMAEAAAVMDNVSASMKRISELEEPGSNIIKKDDEVDFWRNKIAALSAAGPPSTSSLPSPPPKTNLNRSGLKRQPVKTSSGYGQHSVQGGKTSVKTGSGRQTTVPAAEPTSDSTIEDHSSSSRGSAVSAIRRKKSISATKTNKARPAPTSSAHSKVRSSGYGRQDPQEGERIGYGGNSKPLHFDADKAKAEEDFWKKKIEALSAPSTFVSGGSPVQLKDASPSQPRGSAVHAVRRGSKVKKDRGDR